MTQKVEIIEVSPRDGLQNEKEILPVQTKIALIKRALEAGFRRIEVASFVNPKRVPQMADAEEICEALDYENDATYIGLVLNQRGALRALKTKVHELGAVACASNGFAIANQGQTALESADVACEIVQMAKEAGKSAQITISTAFGCPFDGIVSESQTLGILEKLVDAKPREIALADTIGVATPSQVKSLITKAKGIVGEIPLRAHFHNTRNLGFANAWAAFETGVRILDSSLGGLGGCPFAPGATGNIASEDLNYMLIKSGIETGVEIEKTIEIGLWLNEIMGRKLPSFLPFAGDFPKLI